MVPKLRFKEFCGEWEEKRLGDVFKFMPTNSFSRNDLNYIEGDIYNIHYGDVHMIYPTITDAQKETFPYINREKKLDVCSELLCEDGDVLLADASEDYDDIGKAIEIINVGDKKIVSGLHTIFMKDYKKIYANKFRGFMMNSNSVRKQIKVLAAGAKVLGISKSNIAKVKMPLPSLPEQIKIADFLSTVDDKMQNQEDKITHLENIKKGFMQKIFSRKIRFKDDGGEKFPEWEEKKLGNICKMFSGGTPTSGKSEYYGGNINFIRSGEIHLNKTELTLTQLGFDSSSAKLVEIGDILYALYGATSGEVNISKINGAINQAILCIRPDEYYNKKYLAEILNFKKKSILNTYLQGGQGNLSGEIIKNLKLKFPCLKEQQKIADFLSSFDEKISIEKETLEHLKQLKKGLLQQMFV